MNSTPTPPTLTTFKLPPFSFWKWAGIQLLLFVACFYVIGPMGWSLGLSYFASLYSLPLTQINAHPEAFVRMQLLFVCIPSLLFLALAISLLAWRRWLAYAPGLVVGVLGSDVRDYVVSLANRFQGEGLLFPHASHAHLLATYLAHCLR